MFFADRPDTMPLWVTSGQFAMQSACPQTKDQAPINGSMRALIPREAR
jgi:hypothetical protein